MNGRRAVVLVVMGGCAPLVALAAFLIVPDLMHRGEPFDGLSAGVGWTYLAIALVPVLLTLVVLVFASLNRRGRIR